MFMQLTHLFWIGILTFVVLLIIIFFWTRAQKEKTQIAPALYVEALQALVGGDEPLAFQKLKQVVAEDSSNLDAYLKIGDTLRRRNKPAQALQVHQDLLLRPDLDAATRTAVLKSIAQDYLAGENYSRAEKILHDLAQADGHNPWVYRQLLSVCEAQKDWEGAFAAAERLMKLGGEKNLKVLAKYKMLLGQKLVAAGDYHKARIAFKEALDYDLQAVPAYLAIGDAYAEERRTDDAVAFWRKVLEVEPKAGYLVFGKLEKAYFELGQFNEVTEIYQQVLKRDPKNVPARYGLGQIFEKKGMIQPAIEYFTSLLDLDPSFMPARLNLIRIFRSQKRYDLALDVVESFLEHLVQPSRSYACEACGAEVSEPTWVCPKCRAWNSFPLW